MSRLYKYKVEKKQGFKRKFVIGLVSLSTTFVLTTGVAFANSELNISTLLQDWYSKKANEAIVKMEGEVQRELEEQKLRLKEEVQLKLQSSAEEIDSFTETQTNKIIAEIQKYADELIKNANFSNGAEKQQIEAKLAAIQNEATQAIDALFSSSGEEATDPASSNNDSDVIEEVEEEEEIKKEDKKEKGQEKKNVKEEDQP
ncbi:hypothetical protein H1D32_21400 [Anaerobacillus sp. CMMVII]|uniref:hypothetical protein n=1 Tax=Anaerobacillus sp. CMMVII TaxID=2755588 RepID=UPI0021B7DFFA|nr:hypothetical protein [Anaerobacillus sp. CMMVII]MCT8140016.1 hypothetical protein [Anaerobacillus sp. CMMVII]